MSLLSGCIFSPDEGGGGGPPPPPSYEKNSSPDRVLVNLKKAYEARDSVYYKTLYDSSYTGKSTIVTDPNPAATAISVTYHDEVSHVAAMARSTEITKVYMYLGAAWPRQASDVPAHPEYAVIQLTNNYSIQVYRTTDFLTVDAGPGDEMSFTFKPTTPAASSPTDTLWTIIQWIENTSN